MRVKVAMLAVFVLLVVLVTVALAQIPYPAYTTGNTSAGGDIVKAATTAAITSSGNYVVPIGTWYISPDTYGQVQINVGTAASPNWQPYVATAKSAFLFSDGGMVRILNTSNTTWSTETLFQMK